MCEIKTLYVSDLDGTLLSPDGKLSETTINILKPLIEKGLLFTVATARSPATAVDLLAPLCLKVPAVLMTGTILYDFALNKTVKTFGLTHNAAEELATILDIMGREAHMYTVKNGHLYVYYKNFENAFEEKFVSERVGTPYKTYEKVSRFTSAMAGGNVLMFLFCLDNIQKAADLADKLRNIDNTTCYYYANEYGNGITMEVYPNNVDKASTLENVKKLLGADELVTFGDNINDISMFKTSDRSYAVGNAVFACKNHATSVIGTNAEDGVAKFIYEDFTKQPF